MLNHSLLDIDLWICLRSTICNYKLFQILMLFDVLKNFLEAWFPYLVFIWNSASFSWMLKLLYCNFIDIYICILLNGTVLVYYFALGNNSIFFCYITWLLWVFKNVSWFITNTLDTVTSRHKYKYFSNGLCVILAGSYLQYWNNCTVKDVSCFKCYCNVYSRQFNSEIVNLK